VFLKKDEAINVYWYHSYPDANVCTCRYFADTLWHRASIKKNRTK